MLLRTYLLLGLAAAGVEAPAAAAIDVEAEAALVSDYRYRGLSLSDGKPAFQASLTASHDSGFYFNAWDSSIKEPGERLAAELDFTAGHEFSLSEQVRLDLSATWYLYPSDASSNYAEATAIITGGFGHTSASLGFSLVPPQQGTRDELGSHPNKYVFGELSYEIPDSPVTLAAHAGYERGYFDEVEGGGKTDWSLGIEAAFGRLGLGLAYVGCNADAENRHGVTASAQFSF